MPPSSRAGIAALLAQVMESRYPMQPLEPSQKEDWVRAALESDPLVLFEAAWMWWREHESGDFRPSPGKLLKLADAWPVGLGLYVGLHEALDAEESPGLGALIDRYGRIGWSEINRTRILPSQESRWWKANQEHRRYVFAKQLLEERGALPWNPRESGPIQIANGHMRELMTPRSANEAESREFTARLTALTQTKKLK